MNSKVSESKKSIGIVAETKKGKKMLAENLKVMNKSLNGSVNLNSSRTQKTQSVSPSKGKLEAKDKERLIRNRSAKNLTEDPDDPRWKPVRGEQKRIPSNEDIEMSAKKDNKKSQGSVKSNQSKN